jgi:MoaA/NifB/PqqE/SkfB family radical SAM enzyme
MEPKKENVFECSAVTKWLEIELTNYCSMHCIVCPREKLSNFWFLSFDDFKKIVLLLKEWSYTEIMVCWLGDAFLHKEINDFMDYLFKELPKIKLFFMTKWQSIKDKHLLKIKELNNAGYNVSLTFSIFSLNKKVYNYLTWWDFFDNFISILNKSNKLQINYSIEFMLSNLTLGEINGFIKFAKNLWKDYWISLVHNWWWKIWEIIHSKFFNKDILDWYYITRKKWDICEVMKYDYLYIDSFWDVFQCSLNEIDRTGYLWKLGQYTLKEFLHKKNSLNYKKICSNCFYFNYKTFS